MSKEIEELVKRLDEHWGRRRIGDISCLLADAADALEAMAREVEVLKASLNEWVRENAPGGWIDELRKKAQECDQLAAEANTLIKTKNGLAELSAQKETRAEAAEAERDRLRNEKVAHVFYKTGDKDCPAAILDQNNEVVLQDCRVCGESEGTLAEFCPGAPAADPAPAVCVWHMTPSDGYEGSCDEDCMWFSAYEECPSCGKPIKFTEAKE